ncbi:MAG TPA: restriction endonuclease [Anaerolineae bacterium]|nr:restriction endonuclease [Anaerolineae bacterium]
MTRAGRTHVDAERQIARLQRLNKEQALGKLQAMSPQMFKRLTAMLFELQGYGTTVTLGSGDKGVDIWATKSRWIVVAQCERDAASIGQPVVRDLYGTLQHSGADEAYLITTAQVSRQAREWAADKPIHLIDGFALVDWIMSATVASPSLFSAVRIPFVLLGGLMALAAIVVALALIVVFPQVSRRLGIGSNPTSAWVPPTVTQSQAINTPAATIPPPAATAEVVAAQPTPTASSEPSPAATVLPAATATPEPPPSPTATPEPAATAVNTCAVDVAADLADLYNRPLLGCATGDASIVWSAWQPFERGYMLWRSDSDAAYAFAGSSEGMWLELSDRWDGSAPVSRGDPPAGLQAPIRGFGYVWSRNDDLFHNLGWAADQEKGFCASLQPFELGFLLRSSAVESCTAEGDFNHAHTPDWTPISLVAHASGWSGGEHAGTGPSDVALEPASTPPTPSPTASPQPVATLASPHSRPKSQGMFFADADESVVLDGRFDEWPNQWIPIAAVVHGHADLQDSSDLAGSFQVSWSVRGLALALQAGDELHRSGPQGTLMWMGDGLEIHFDRLLRDDFETATVDEDDTQIGVSYGPGLDEVRGYRWYPYDRETQLDLPGVVSAQPTGYSLEILLPWSVFGVQPGDLSPGQSFGFNITMNDNDGDTPAQQTTLSASPARTTYDNPTEWGTLVLQ